MDQPNPTIKVAIIGGGLEGVAVLRGLLKYPHIAVDIFEARPSFREEGAGIHLSRTSQAVLNAIEPALQGCLERAGAVYGSDEIRLAAGPQAGSLLNIAGMAEHSRLSVDRQPLLDELLTGVPESVMHPEMRLVSIKDAPSGNGVVLQFSDDSKRAYDLVVGAEGVHGKLRKHILGEHDPAVNPVSSGWWGLPVKVPLERAQRAMGAEFLDPSNPLTVGWLGYGTILYHNLVNDGRDVDIVTFAKFEELEDQTSWARLFMPEEYEEIFSHNNSSTVQGMVKLIQSIYTIQIAGFCLMQHLPARSYVTKNAVMVGDSAHAILPFVQSRMALALEEALILSDLLARVASPAEIPFALQAFDLTCRPRAEEAREMNEEASMLLSGRVPGVGLDADLLIPRMESIMDHLEVDIGAYQAGGLRIMNQLRGSR